MREGGGGRRERKLSSALSLFRFHLSPFPPETPDTQASDQPLIPTSPLLKKQQFSTSSRDQNSSWRQQGGSDGG